MPSHKAKRPDPKLWDQLKPLAREMRHSPTPAEQALWQHLRNRQMCGVKFRRQHAISRFIVDFYAPQARLVIEVDGGIHVHRQEEDAVRQATLENLNLRVLRFTNEQVLNEMEAVLESIAEMLGEA